MCNSNIIHVFLVTILTPLKYMNGEDFTILYQKQIIDAVTITHRDVQVFP